jgi:hypothetical protein
MYIRMKPILVKHTSVKFELMYICIWLSDTLKFNVIVHNTQINLHIYVVLVENLSDNWRMKINPKICKHP